MKSLRSSVMLLALVFMFAAMAFARSDAHKGSFTISGPAEVAGTQLAAGDYTVKWDGTGPTTQLTILRSGKTVATVTARVQTLGYTPTQDSVALKPVNGVNNLTGIQFGGKNYALEIAGEVSGGNAGSNSLR